MGRKRGQGKRRQGQGRPKVLCSHEDEERDGAADTHPAVAGNKINRGRVTAERGRLAQPVARRQAREANRRDARADGRALDTAPPAAAKDQRKHNHLGRTDQPDRRAQEDGRSQGRRLPHRAAHAARSLHRARRPRGAGRRPQGADPGVEEEEQGGAELRRGPHGDDAAVPDLQEPGQEHVHQDVRPPLLPRLRPGPPHQPRPQVPQLRQSLWQQRHDARASVVVHVTLCTTALLFLLESFFNSDARRSVRFSPDDIPRASDAANGVQRLCF